MVNVGFISGGSPVLSTTVEAGLLQLVATGTLNVEGVLSKRNLYNADTVTVDKMPISSDFTNSLLIRNYLVGNKVTYNGDPSSVVTAYQSYQDLKIKVNRLFYLSTVSYQFWS